MSVTAAPNVTGGRMSAGARNMAAVDPGPISELNPGFGVFYNDAMLRFQDYGRGAGDRRHAPQLPNAQRFDTPSEAFAQVYEESQQSGDVGRPLEGIDGPSFRGTLARAIDIYETNMRVVSGNTNVLGESLSINL